MTKQRKIDTIKNRTYNNFLEARKHIIAKGYTAEEAGDIIRRCFDNMEMDREWHKTDLAIGFYVDRIISKAAYIAQKEGR